MGQTVTEQQHHHTHEQTLTDYLAVLKRRKWVVLLSVVVATGAAVAMSLSQPKLFSSTADVLLTSAATGVSSPLNGSATSAIQTQAEIASSPVVAERALKATGLATRS